MFDLVIHNGYIVTASDILPPSVYIGIKDGIIQTMTTEPLEGIKVIDAQGGYVTPGGIDSHVHIDQDNAPTGDNFESGSRSAIAGGNTTILPFAIQPKGSYDLKAVVADYHKRASVGAYCDYGFHLIVSDPNATMLKQLPEIVSQEGITSIKVYTTYPRYKLNDSQLLDILLETRKLEMTTMIHAENSDVIDFINEKLQEKKMTDPYYHSMSRPIEAEEEASYRVISLAKIIDVPILIVHMSSELALSHVENAQKQLTPIYAETCPQYLFLTSDYLKQGCCNHKHADDSFEGAKYICSPPLRQDQKELEGVWRSIINGTVTVFSSDHAPSKYDHPKGKKLGIVNGLPHYKQVPNGLPGIETRLPLLFCYGVETGRITPQKFVELCSTNPAKLYGLSDKKGTIGIGYDADFTIWYPKGQMKPFELDNKMLHHDIDYSPFEGMTFTNWPRYTVLRGEIAWDRDNGGVLNKLGSGNYLKRGPSTLAGPKGELNPIFA
ncbi:Dihydropyrimidinase [Cyberlindnera fabianii]|uniref:dihydropyrimidinase n=1 Tax=Cyberlindnera fabianii TaxID=36022 RepID=A0A1V2KZH4_CYBFA|nr:Dihydropyrimidinase [Cyberlindnera fabianii]